MNKEYVIFDREVFEKSDFVQLDRIDFSKYAGIIDDKIVQVEIADLVNPRKIGLITDEGIAQKIVDMYGDNFCKVVSVEEFYSKRAILHFAQSLMEPDDLLRLIYHKCVKAGLFITKIDFIENKIFAESKKSLEVIFDEDGTMAAFTTGNTKPFEQALWDYLDFNKTSTKFQKYDSTQASLFNLVKMSKKKGA